MSSYVTLTAIEAHRQDLLRAAERSHSVATEPRLRFAAFERVRRSLMTDLRNRRGRRAPTPAEVATARGA